MKFFEGKTFNSLKDLHQRVEDSMTDAARSDDEGVVTEDFSESRGSSETKDTIDERKCSVIRCQEQSCQASQKFETILKVGLIIATVFTVLSIFISSTWKILMRS